MTGSNSQHDSPDAFCKPKKRMDGSEWAMLLSAQPQFADRCPWEKLDGDAWWKLLGVQPQFEDKCPQEILKRVQKKGCLMAIGCSLFMCTLLGVAHFILFAIFGRHFGWPGTIVARTLDVYGGFLWWVIMAANSFLWGVGCYTMLYALGRLARLVLIVRHEGRHDKIS